jgi:riboflavin synthase
MFTGLITGVGTVREVLPIGDGKDARFVISVPADDPVWSGIGSVKLGASIACSGCCLTVIERGDDFFTVEVSAETLAFATLGTWQPGSRINLEGSLKLGDELGGHLVSGHVDGVAEVVSATPENGSTRWRFRVPPTLSRFIAPKGSIAINGVSLTVNEVQDRVAGANATGFGANATEFGVNIIPHTEAHTNFSSLQVGDSVNIEIDMLARYVARLQSFQND